MRDFSEQLGMGKELMAFMERLEREGQIYRFVCKVEREKERHLSGAVSHLDMLEIRADVMDVLENASTEVGWQIVCFMADDPAFKEILLEDPEEIYMLFSEKKTEFFELFPEVVFELFKALLSNGNVTSDLLQTIDDYSYELSPEQNKELVDLIHENVGPIVENVLFFETNKCILSALWLLENRFGMSYVELREAIRSDVARISLLQCDEYPELKLYSYYLVKAGYDYFYEKREELMVTFPAAARTIAKTFPYMEVK
ncbi:MAG: hypothetical protein J6M02_02090 [Clostridia bacterium]|nr:hypothetical protein [Clostridia bacterium]